MPSGNSEASDHFSMSSDITMIVDFGSRSITMPVRTLLSLCKQFAPGTIDFLKIDVEGAERAVLLGGDWQRFRPKVVVAEEKPDEVYKALKEFFSA